LGSSGNSRYTTSAELLKNIIYWCGTSRYQFDKFNEKNDISNTCATNEKITSIKQ